MLIDISRPLHPGSPHWPGDCPTAFHLNARIAAGSSCNVGELRLSVHNGTHADAPFHYDDRGATIDALDLGCFVGPARVIDARGHAALTAELLAGLGAAEIAAAPRVLFRTDAWGDPGAFPTAWPLLDPDLPARLAARGAVLVGLDVPSVDELTSKDLPRHRRMDAAGLLILESLDLRGVEAGVYELIALPLRLRGADGSPVRAVLRRALLP
ncbi:MAG: cyclase family protein [Verrucomicrobiota bacterium]